MSEQAPAAQSVNVNPSGEPDVTPENKKKAVAWFERGSTVADTRNYDYAIECYLNGLQLWPEAIEEGIVPLRDLALKRQAAGGKKPGLGDTLKRSTSTKDKKNNLLNALFLSTKDPQNASYLEAIAKNATELGCLHILTWVFPILYDSLRTDKNLKPERLLNLRDWCEQAADMLETDPQGMDFLQKALSLAEVAEALGARTLADSQRKKNLAAKITMRKGKYDTATSFRDSIDDAKAQEKIHDQDRVVKTEDQYNNILANARKAYEDAPTVAAKLFGLVDLLVGRERYEEENEAIALLKKKHEETKEYRFRSRMQDILLKQARRRAGELTRQAQSATDAAAKTSYQQKAEKLAKDIVAFELKTLSERVENYPTDMNVRYQYGDALFRAGKYDEAISVFQVAQNDPKNKARALLKTGQCFFLTKFYPEAAETFKQALDGLEIQNDDTGKELMYSLGRCFEELKKPDEALAYYSRVAQLEFNYRDARARITKLRGV